MRRLKSILLLCLLFSAVHAQPYLATRATMYDQGPDPYFPPAGVAGMEVWRYLPGARFESGWDLRIETRQYDKAGHLLSWTRYQTVSGTLAWQKDIAYDAQGHRSKETVLFAAEAPPVVYTFKNTTHPDGRLKTAEILTADGQLFAAMEALPGGGLQYVQDPGKPTSQTYRYDDKGRSLSFQDAGTERKITYEYDFRGELTAVRNESKGMQSDVTYKNEYDKDGRLVRQTETLGKRVVARNLHYDAANRLIMKSDETGRPVEYRDYFPNGRLASILLTNPEGHPMEVIRYVYRDY